MKNRHMMCFLSWHTRNTIWIHHHHKHREAPTKMPRMHKRFWGSSENKIKILQKKKEKQLKWYYLHIGQDRTSLWQRAQDPRHMVHTRTSIMDSSASASSLSSSHSYSLLLLVMVLLIHLRAIQQLFFHHLSIYILDSFWFKHKHSSGFRQERDRAQKGLCHLDKRPSNFQRSTKRKPHSNFSKCHKAVRVLHWTRKLSKPQT